MSLSLNQGGWIHPHVMDCFGMLLTTEQIEQKKETGSNEVLNHIVIKDITVCIVPKPSYIKTTLTAFFFIRE
jgi:hypothetical protein